MTAAAFPGEVRDAAAAHALGPDYVRAVGKVGVSHVRNELAADQVPRESEFDLFGGPPGPVGGAQE